MGKLAKFCLFPYDYVSFAIICALLWVLTAKENYFSLYFSRISVKAIFVRSPNRFCFLKPDCIFAELPALYGGI